MVHALEMTHSLLKKDGLLIDIHPSGQPPQVEVHNGQEIQLAGHLQEVNAFVEYFQADDALQDVTNRGLFELERQGTFPFLIHAPTVKALADHLADEWTDAILPEATSARAATLLGEPGRGMDSRKEIVVREIVHIARFRVNSR